MLVINDFHHTNLIYILEIGMTFFHFSQCYPPLLLINGVMVFLKIVLQVILKRN